MIPARHPEATPRDGSQNATVAAAPTRPASPAPQIDTISTRESNPLFLRLSFPKGSGEPPGQDAAPRSPSSRSKAKAQRAITENRGRKRAIDGKDGPGSPATGAAKRQKEWSPPASPRSGTSSPRYLVKQSRPVKDLKTMAGLSPRRAESASPPPSPRSARSGAPSATGNLPASLQGKPALAASLAASGTWAHGSASIGSSAPAEALAPLASSSTNDGRHPGTTGESAEEFTFADVAFGDNGEA